MDCRRIEQLISPYLDGELSQPEYTLIKSHLEVCAHCAHEYENMHRITAACRDLGKIQIAAPVGFKEALMQKISEEPRVLLPAGQSGWLRQHMKQSAAAVAAAVMIAVGAISMNPAPISQIAEKIPVLQQNDYNFNHPDLSDQGGIQVGNPDPANNPTVPGMSNSQNNAVVALAPNIDGSAPVFLNKERYIVSTLLQVMVVDSAGSLEQAIKLIEKAQAQSLNLGQQVNEKGTYTVLKITVARSAANDLIGQLSSLGTVTGKEVDKNDITTRYAATLSQYQALVTQRNTEQDSLQIASLDQRISSLSQDMLNWEQQAEQETIVLWLEK